MAEKDNSPLTPDLVARTPEVKPAVTPVTATTTTTEPEVVHFTPAQQAKLDEIVKSAMGRAAGQLRQENNQLRKSLESALAAAQPDASELEKTRAALEATKLRLEDPTQERQAALLEAEIVAAANVERFVDVQQATLLLDKSSFVKPDGSLDLEAAKNAVRALANKSPHLIKGDVKSGSGSFPDQNIPQPPVKLESLFGRGSNAAEANRLAISDPQRYKTLRADARKRGLI
jgi:hypothetical protein